MMKQGAPVKWNVKLEAKALEYIEKGWIDEDHAVPMIVGMCKYIGIRRSTVYLWAEKEEYNFKEILETLKERQELVVFSKSLKGEYNASMAKLMLTKHGYSDKVDSDVTSGGKSIKNEWHIHPVTANKDG